MFSVFKIVCDADIPIFHITKTDRLKLLIFVYISKSVESRKAKKLSTYSKYSVSDNSYNY